jgi:hypothetical protein
MGAEQLNRLAAAFGNEFEHQISRRIGFEGNRFAAADSATEESEDWIVRGSDMLTAPTERWARGRQSLNGMSQRRIAEASGEASKNTAARPNP